MTTTGPVQPSSTDYSINLQGKSDNNKAQVNRGFYQTLLAWVTGIAKNPGGSKNAYEARQAAAMTKFGAPLLVYAPPQPDYGRPVASSTPPSQTRQPQGQGTSSQTIPDAPGAQPASIEGEQARVESGGTFFAQPIASLPQEATLGEEQFQQYYARYIDELTNRGISTENAEAKWSPIQEGAADRVIGFNGESWGHTQDGWVLNGVSNGTAGVGEYHTGIGHFVTDTNGQRVWREQSLQEVYDQYDVAAPTANFPQLLQQESQGLVEQFWAGVPTPPVARPADANAGAVTQAGNSDPAVAAEDYPAVLPEDLPPPPADIAAV